MGYGEGDFKRIRLPGTLVAHEAAKALGVSVDTFTGYVQRGKIKAVPREKRPDSSVAIYREEDIEALGIKRLLKKGLKKK